MRNDFFLSLMGLCLFLSTSCITEKYTLYEATLVNTTNHTITILPHKNGIVLSKDTIHLEANEHFLIAEGSHRGGDIKVPGFSSEYFGGYNDSIIVLFDNIYRVVHYATTPQPPLSEKHYLSNSKRNIANPESYEFEREKGKLGVFLNIHNYYFTEEDYIYASE